MGEVIAYFLLGTLVLGLFTFVITYAIGSNWRKYVVGRYMLYFILTIAGTFFYILILPLVRFIPGRIYIDLIVLLLLNYGAWKLTWLLRRIQKGKFDNEQTERTDEESIR